MDTLIGKTFGLYTVIGSAKSRSSSRMWLCACICGQKRTVPTRNLNSGNSKSCGCIKRLNFQKGQRFGRLSVIGVHGKSKYRTKGGYEITWECRCDCGNLHVVKGHGLKSGRTRSCGCFRDENRGLACKLPDGEASANNLIGKYKRSAKKKQRIFSLTKNECMNIFAGNCYYCGCVPAQKHSYRTGHGNRGTPFIYNGIDRIDSSKGYEITNVVSCCHVCNTAKMAMPQADFFAWVIRTAENVKKYLTPQGVIGSA